jgi:hypothetical protein
MTFSACCCCMIVMLLCQPLPVYSIVLQKSHICIPVVTSRNTRGKDKRLQGQVGAVYTESKVHIAKKKQKIINTTSNCTQHKCGDAYDSSRGGKSRQCSHCRSRFCLAVQTTRPTRQRTRSGECTGSHCRGTQSASPCCGRPQHTCTVLSSQFPSQTRGQLRVWGKQGAVGLGRSCPLPLEVWLHAEPALRASRVDR